MRYSVVINDRMLRSAKTGVGHYTAQLLYRLPRVRPEARFIPFHATHISRRRLRDASATNDEPGPVLRPPLRWPWTVRRFLQIGYEVVFRRIVRRCRYQLYHEPNHIPMACDLPTVTTIHDLSVLRFPQWHPADRIAWYEACFDRGLRQTEHFITVSRFTRDECLRYLNIDPSRITVIYQAPREVFGAGPVLPETGRQVRKALGLPEHFLLFVGTVEPRKNLMGLLEAYARLEVRIRRRWKLVLVGMQGWETESITERLRRLDVAADVRQTGYLSDERLAVVFGLATLFVFPSRYEGFGLPPLEAMASGCPCVISNAEALVEVAGDAAVAVDPDDTAAMAEAITRLIDDSDLRQTLIRRGRSRAAQFGWQPFAEGHDAVYRRVLGDYEPLRRWSAAR